MVISSRLSAVFLIVISSSTFSRSVQGGTACCSQSFAECTTYCQTEEECKTCGDTTVVWLPNGVPAPNSCIARWGVCTTNVTGCCQGLSCVGDQYWAGCQYVPPNNSTAPPTVAPVKSPGCCSQSFAECTTYCQTEQECKTCGDTTVVWLPNGVPTPNSCIARWGVCTTNVTGCCPGLTCVGDQYWAGCQYVPLNTTNVTIKPTATPSKAPIKPTIQPVAPTPQPVAPTVKPVTPTATPVGPTPTPVTLTLTPVAPTLKPVAPTTPPVVPTKAPVAPIIAPVNPSTSPVTPTKSPLAPQVSPTQGLASPPVSPTQGPVAPPVSPTQGPITQPVSPTQAPNSPVTPTVPVSPTIRPISPTTAPVTPTIAPVAPTVKPVAPTVKPVAPTVMPVAPTVKPVAPTVKPVSSTSAPVSPTAAPIPVTSKPTAVPVSPTTAPITPTIKPVVSPTVAPVTPTKAPTLPTTAPITSTVTPVTPTKSPTTPTSAPITPTAPPAIPTTPSPTAVLPPFPAGPYITAAASSERIVIPGPQTPNLTATRTSCPHLQSGLLDWYSASTWGGTIPLVGQNVTLPANSTVVVTRSVVEQLGYVTIPSGSTLVLGESSTGIAIDALGFDVQGVLQAGSETCRIETSITITLHGTRPADAVTNPKPITYKGIAVTGTLSLHGKRFFRTWTRLAKTVNVGDSVLMLQHAVNWKAGQQLVLVTTAMKDSKEWHQNEVLVVKAVSLSPPANVGAVVYLTTAATYKHVANSGYQAEVGLLSRAIVVQGAANDSEPTDPDPLTCQGSRWIYGNYAQPCGNMDLTGFGAHVVIHSGGKGYVEGIELFRVGQTNVLGKYPMHFHLLGECPDCYFRDSSIHRSYYRCISVHGTNSSLVSENVAYDVRGFCYYLEDGVESNNTLSFNLAALIHNIGPENPWGYGQTTNVYQQSSTLTNPADVTASGFYITNVHNNIIGNAASGGWSGFAFPNLPTALQSFRSLVFRPSSVTSLNIDGNTAHSSGWWWNHAGAFYFGGALYYNGNNVLEYNPGRDFDVNHGRSTCTVNACQLGDCNYGCPQYSLDAVHMTNTKAFLVSSVGLNSWTGRIEVVGYEAHDAALMLESLSDGFWMDNALAVCRTGETLVMPSGGSAQYIRGNGFFWYDTYQSHIITNAEFRYCGFRSDQYNQYDNSTIRGCGTSDSNGCDSQSTTFGFLAHSDQYIPQLMQGTKAITFNNCGRRFFLFNFNGPTAPETVSGRSQNWIDADGSVTGFRVPSIIGSGDVGSQGWWQVEDEVVYDPQGPLRFIKQTNGPQRGLGHFKMTWDSSVNSQVGGSVCSNGNTNIPCPTLGYVRHLGRKFSPSASGAAPGMPINAGGNIVGPVGGFGWLLNFYAGAPKSITFPEVVVRPATPLILSIPYPQGTSFNIVAHAPSWCWTENGAYSCQQQFSAVSSLDQVRNGQGNVYYVDPNGVLTVRLVQLPKDFVGRPNWFLPALTDPGRDGLGLALDYFQRNGVLLPRVIFGSYFTLDANCPASGAYCSQVPPAYDPDVCPSGYQQTSYDACCSSSTGHCVYADGSTA